MKMKFKTPLAIRRKVTAWREQNKTAIAAARAEGITLTEWREKHEHAFNREPRALQQALTKIRPTQGEALCPA